MEGFGDYPVKSNVHERQKLTTNFIGIVGGEVSKAGDLQRLQTLQGVCHYSEWGGARELWRNREDQRRGCHVQVMSLSNTMGVWVRGLQKSGL